MRRHLPMLVVFSVVSVMLWHGPIVQWAHYNDFADLRPLFGLPNAADVLSNLGFLISGTWGLLRLWPLRRHAALQAGWSGYCLFMIGLILTAAGSGFYHLAPDNARLVWDRLPIALACAGLLAAVRAETLGTAHWRTILIGLALFSQASVLWWGHSGDLRPYLLIQGLPLLLIPIWQHLYDAPRADRYAFGIAILLYVAAKVAELHDAAFLSSLQLISGHTLKHLLATAASTVLIARLVRRTK